MTTHLRHWGRHYRITAVAEYTDQFGQPHTQVDLLVKNRLVRKTFYGHQAHLYQAAESESVGHQE